MDKLIKDIEEIISDSLTGGLFKNFSCFQDIAIRLSCSLCDYKRRRSRLSCKSKSVMEISPEQFSSISLMIQIANERYSILNEQHSVLPETVEQGFLYGYVDAVRGFMRILGMDIESLYRK